MKNKKRRIKGPNKSVGNIPSQTIGYSIKSPVIPTNNGFSFYSVYPWIRGTNKFWKDCGFTNLCKSKEEFADEMAYMFDTLIPKLYSDYDDIFAFGSHNFQYQHCHTLTGMELETAIKIASEIHGRVFPKFENDTISWWQVGFTSGKRLVGLFDSNEKAFYPLFVDRHHLLYPNLNYNDNDFSHYSYNPSVKN